MWDIGADSEDEEEVAFNHDVDKMIEDDLVNDPTWCPTLEKQDLEEIQHGQFGRESLGELWYGISHSWDSYLNRLKDFSKR